MTPAQRYAAAFAAWRAAMPRQMREDGTAYWLGQLHRRPHRRREDWLSHENVLHRGSGRPVMVPALEPGPGMCPGLFS